MKKFLALTFLLMVHSVWFDNVESTQAGGNRMTTPAEVQLALQATVRIEVRERVEISTEVIANALGSIVRMRGKTVIVTHNHWGSVLGRTSQVSLYRTDGRLMASMMGWQVWAAVLYQDAGTLVISAPSSVVDFLQREQVTIPEVIPPQRLEPGSIVWAVRREDKDGKNPGFMAMEVEIVHESQQPPVYLLRSLSGQSILPGDSGGGVWVGGSLAGNLWSTVMIPASVEKPGIGATVRAGVWHYTDESYAAIFSWQPAPCSGASDPATINDLVGEPIC